jgi:5-methylcytosine-specific restriction endonuclease McrA
MSIVDICKKYGLNMIKDMKKVKTTKNICLFKFRTEQVNSHIHNLLNPNENYFIVGKDYICKEHHKQQGFTLHTNYTYKLIKLTPKTATLYDEIDNQKYTFDRRILTKKFKQPYALTCDSIQGLSFDKGEAITIFDSNTDYCDRRFLWVAITRCRALQDVNIYIHSESEVNSLKNSRLRLYYKNKIIGYKHQDTKANRNFRNIIDYGKDKYNTYFGCLTNIMYNDQIQYHEYVNHEWLEKKLKKCKFKCNNCDKHMEIYIDDATVKSNITIDRVNSKLPHIISNCQLLCHSCNSAKGNRY